MLLAYLGLLKIFAHYSWYTRSILIFQLSDNGESPMTEKYYFYKLTFFASHTVPPDNEK
jgi:hypothetical protein